MPQTNDPSKENMRLESLPEAIDLSACISVETPAKIDLAAIDTTTLNEREKKFAEWLKSSKRVVYDWGKADFFVSDAPFVIDRVANTITPTPDDKHWVGIYQDDLPRLAGKAWTGEWSPTAADAVLTLLNSGVDVEIINSKKFGPADPVAFVQELRSAYKLPPPLPVAAKS